MSASALYTTYQILIHYSPAQTNCVVLNNTTELLARCCHAGHTNNKHMQVSVCWILDASTQDVALDQPKPRWAYVMPVKVCRVAQAPNKHIGLKMF